VIDRPRGLTQWSTGRDGTGAAAAGYQYGYYTGGANQAVVVPVADAPARWPLFVAPADTTLLYTNVDYKKYIIAI
jgi:hypothetical protein